MIALYLDTCLLMISIMGGGIVTEKDNTFISYVFPPIVNSSCYRKGMEPNGTPASGVWYCL